jgi:hypothetical protein
MPQLEPLKPSDPQEPMTSYVDPQPKAQQLPVTGRDPWTETREPQRSRIRRGLRDTQGVIASTGSPPPKRAAEEA